MRAWPVMRTSWSSSFSLAVVFAGLTLGVSGCALSPESQAQAQLRDALASSVGESQDIAWQFREELVADPETALPGVSGVVDARPAFTDARLRVPSGTWLLLDVTEDADGTSLTLVASGAAEVGSGPFGASSSGVTCFQLQIAHDASRIETVGSECVDKDGRGLGDLGIDPQPAVIPLQELDVRRSVDESDYEPLPCQCSSGGDCDCPGG